jgi:hypothetical protein
LFGSVRKRELNLEGIRADVISKHLRVRPIGERRQDKEKHNQQCRNPDPAGNVLHGVSWLLGFSSTRS